MIQIEKLQTSDIEATKALIVEYLRWMREDLSFQHVEKELATFPDIYKEPEGTFLVAKDGDIVIGCVGIKKIEDSVCEMKRLYVKDDYKGEGIGRALVENILSEARKKGYQKIRLDTLKRMERALGLYEKYGFYYIGQYVENPIEDALFMEKTL